MHRKVAQCIIARCHPYKELVGIVVEYSRDPIRIFGGNSGIDFFIERNVFVVITGMMKDALC